MPWASSPRLGAELEAAKTPGSVIPGLEALPGLFLRRTPWVFRLPVRVGDASAVLPVATTGALVSLKQRSLTRLENFNSNIHEALSALPDLSPSSLDPAGLRCLATGPWVRVIG